MAFGPARGGSLLELGGVGHGDEKESGGWVDTEIVEKARGWADYMEF